MDVRMDRWMDVLHSKKDSFEFGWMDVCTYNEKDDQD
jgi:hypothetical protein